MIRLIKPYISFEDVREDFQTIFESGIFTQGEYAKRLPVHLCEYTGAKYAFGYSLCKTQSTGITFHVRLDQAAMKRTSCFFA